VIRARITGHKELAGNLRYFGQELSRRNIRGILARAEYVLEQAQERFIPEDLGNLSDSGRIVVSPKGWSVSVVFGGPGIPQAVAIHEHLSEHSPYSWRVAEAKGAGVQWTKPGTGPKYVERPLLEEARDLARNMNEELDIESIL